MKPKRMKPVKAWAVVRIYNDAPTLVSTTDLWYDRGFAKDNCKRTGGLRIAAVLITELPTTTTKKKRKKGRKV
jgi:hypothetical protein